MIIIIHPPSFIRHHSSFILHHSSSIIYHPSFIIHPSSSIIHHHHPSFILHPPSFIIHHSSFILHPSSFILSHPQPSSSTITTHHPYHPPLLGASSPPEGPAVFPQPAATTAGPGGLLFDPAGPSLPGARGLGVTRWNGGSGVGWMTR